MRGANTDADDVETVVIERKVDGNASAADGRGALFVHQAFGNQLIHDLGDIGAEYPGLFRNIGTGNRLVGPNDVEEDGAVHFPDG